MQRAIYKTLIIGGGPAGLAPLVAASREGRLDELLAGGVAIVERGAAIGAGRLSEYAISSDSTAETFLTAVTGHLDPRLGALLDHPLCRELRSFGRNAIPLAKAGALMALIGEILHKAVTATGGTVLVQHEALQARQGSDGRWHTRIRGAADGIETEIVSDSLVLAMGGQQSHHRLATETVAGVALLPAYGEKLIQSDEALRADGLARIGRRLAKVSDPRIAIVGGSTSALASAGLLLRELPEATRGPASITVMHRRPLRVFYPSTEAALADGYTEFGIDDICPISGFVFRLAGFRLDSRDLLMRIRQIGGRVAEPRVRLYPIEDGNASEAHRILENADVIIAALGYRPRLLRLLDRTGHEIPLAARERKAPLVDQKCRVIGAEYRPLPNVFGIGLSAGFVPRGEMGGEPSFAGQANGLWLWQTAVGSLIVNALSQIEPDTRCDNAAVAAIHGRAWERKVDMLAQT